MASLGLVESEYEGPYKTYWTVKADTRMHDAGSCLTISCKTAETSVCIARKAIQKISAPKQNTTQKADHRSGLRTFSKISVTTYYPRFWLFISIYIVLFCEGCHGHQDSRIKLDTWRKCLNALRVAWLRPHSDLSLPSSTAFGTR